MSSGLNNNPIGYASSSGSSAASGGGASGHHNYPQQQLQQADHKENSKSFNDRFRAFFKVLGKGTTVVAGGGAGVGLNGPGYHSSSFSSQKLQSDSAANFPNVFLTSELLDDLSVSQPLHTRVRALQTLTDSCRSRRIEPNTVEKLWTETSDLFVSNDTVARHACFTTFTTIIQNQLEKPGYLRAKLFAFLRSHDNVEDTTYRFQLLKALTENGRDMNYFEEKVGPFLLNWMLSGKLYGNGDAVGVKVEEFMGLLTNVVKFYSSFLDDDVLGGFIQHTCLTALTCNHANDTLACIQLLNNVVSYSMIPPNTLQTVVATLCRTVNVDSLCVSSWKLMRNLLGTNLGFSGLFTLIQFMNPDVSSSISRGSNLSANASDTVEQAGGNEDVQTCSSVANEMDSIVRGAVFYTGVVLWGGSNRVVRSLTRGSNAGGGGGGIVGVVLAAYEKTLARNNPLITYEVLLRVQDLIRHNADSLQVIGWDFVLEIMRKIINYSKQQDFLSSATTSISSSDDQRLQQLRNNNLLRTQIHDTLDLIENVLPTKTFCGSTQKYWETVVEPMCHTRPIPSIESLIEHKHIRLLDSSSTQFLPNLVQFALLHYQKEIRTPLRLQALGVMKAICLLNQDCMEEALLDNVILPNLKNVESESDSFIRQHCVQFIVEFLIDSRSKKGHDLLHYVEKVVNRPFELEKELSNHGQPVANYTEAQVPDILTGVKGIIQIFQRKIYSLPSSIAVTAFKILVRHLEKHYKAKQNCLENCTSIRFQIFECFFRIRANALYHLGFPTDQGIVTYYSSYLAVDHKDPRESGSNSESPYPLAEHQLGGISPPNIAQNDAAKGASSGPPLVSYISLTAACKQVICCLKKERDWKILELVLVQLPIVMENKALILSKHGNDVDILASQLCSMVTDKSLFSSGDSTPFRNTPARFSRSDFLSHVFPALTSLVSYHSSLDTKIQQQIVKCLEHGLVSKSSLICISALTTCTLEMKEIMHKMIPEILLSLSKISPKMNIAIPVLEFLSTLIHLPRVFHSFVYDQYMSIFAICLPYTNPFKFNHYVVSLAHHVIALWFLKCRLSFRRGFVSYIIKGLESNVWAPYIEASERNLINEDSSNRKRSSSLTDQSNRRRERMVSGQASVQGLSRQASYQPVDSGTIQFHQELTETCVDMMARYAFADCSPLPTTFESSGWLIQHGGNSQSWLVDNRIITIATSACTTREMKEGLCDRCWVACRHNQSQFTNSGGSQFAQATPNKRNMLVGQHSYDEQEARDGSTTPGGSIRRSNTISGGHHHPAGGVARRRHRSAMVQQNQQQPQDDLLENKLQLPPHVGGGGIGIGSFGGSEISGRSVGRKEGSSMCMCWCQGWAEVTIKRPTGNTSWMMRVQNVVGGVGYSHTGERLVSNLCGMYVHDIVDGVKREMGDVDTDSSKTSREDLEAGHEDQVAGSQEEMSISTSCSVEVASSSTTSASTPDKGQISPTADDSCNGKVPVKRSNSSPEMTKGSQEPDQDDSQKSSIYLPSCVPIPEETSRRSECEGDAISTAPICNHNNHIKTADPSSPLDDTSQQTLTPIRRDRMFTISVMTPARKNPSPAVRRIMSVGSGDFPRPGNTLGHGAGCDPGIRSGISPSFVFLQLCGHGVFGDHGASNKPLPIPETMGGSLKVIDYIPPYETHKIGVLYIGPGQTNNEAQILQNSHGSLRYREFLQGLGTLIKLAETDPQKTFLGGLDPKGVEDGEFGCIWRDDVMQVIFHIATLMPTRVQSDPNCNGKKKHIGNDFVAIVYNNSDDEFDISTIKCQFLYACVIIQPLDHRTNRIFVKAKPNLGENIVHTDVKIVSDQNLPIMARQLALHSNLASVIHNKVLHNQEPYASNWLERLRKIKALRKRVQDAIAAQSSGSAGGAAAVSTGLSSSAHELNDAVGPAVLNNGSGGQVPGNTSGGASPAANMGSSSSATVAALQKRNTYIVDDFTEYV